MHLKASNVHQCIKGYLDQKLVQANLNEDMERLLTLYHLDGKWKTGNKFKQTSFCQTVSPQKKSTKI